MIKAIIFDIDDTLIDFSKTATKQVQLIAKRLNLKPVNKKEINKLWGTTLKNIVTKIWGKKHLEKFRKEFIKIQKKSRFPPEPYSLSLIKKLKKDYRLGLVSSKSKAVLRLHMELAGFNIKDFLFINAAEDSKYNKPDPRVFSKTINKLKLDPKEILYIGDSIFDYLAAKRTGFKFMAVTTGYYKSRDFQKKGLKKHYILHSLNGVEKCLNAYFVK